MPHTETTVDRLITINEAAELLSLYPHTLRKRCWSGLVPSVKIGRSVRIRQAVINEIITNGEETARAKYGCTR